MQNLHVREEVRLISPRALKAQLPMAERCARTVIEGRQAVQSILQGRDRRMLLVVGPCSIHDPEAALDYAAHLQSLRKEVADSFVILMRVYFEKPRTTVGWKGLINDPHLDGTYDIETGLKMARALLLKITRKGLPAATEFLDPIVPQYIADLVSWAAIGARTTESQTHREMASGLSMPVGFKNATNGNLRTAIEAMTAARHPHSFLGIDQDGVTSIVRTSGNPDGHIVLRGGHACTNYDPESIAEACIRLQEAGTREVLMVDCSHANSGKRHLNQEKVWRSVVSQRAAGNSTLIGLMLESNLHEGRQDIPADPSTLRYGVSITDACLDWKTTERLIHSADDLLRSAARDQRRMAGSQDQGASMRQTRRRRE